MCCNTQNQPEVLGQQSRSCVVCVCVCMESFNPPANTRESVTNVRYCWLQCNRINMCAACMGAICAKHINCMLSVMVACVHCRDYISCIWYNTHRTCCWAHDPTPMRRQYTICSGTCTYLDRSRRANVFAVGALCDIEPMRWNAHNER